MCDVCREYKGKVYHLRKSGRYELGGVRLANVVYENEVGAIPAGHEIHHKDYDSTNDSVENLVALPPEEHWKLHSEDRRKLMHKRYEDADTVQLVCAQCGKTYEKKQWAGRRRSMFCSTVCLDAWRKPPSFVPEIRSCQVCQNEYLAKRPHQKYCSKTCNCKASVVGRTSPYKKQHKVVGKISELTTGI